ncbi:MAG: histidine phosphatase family protein [Myxococcales bacterium]
MSQLTLVRHGQAASFSSDSDRLTELGERQARLLGEHWVQRGVRFDEVVTGTLKRQVDTARLVGEAFEAAGTPWPETRVDRGWNEYDAAAVTGLLAPALAEHSERFRLLQKDFEAHAGTPQQNRYFQRMFEVLMDTWIAGELPVDGLEPFDEFHGRLRAARQRVLQGEGNRSVAVFTSGGPIGACVQLALDAPVAQTLKVNWRVRNTSLTEFLFSRDRLSLDSFNRIPHLPEPELQSFR